MNNNQSIPKRKGFTAIKKESKPEYVSNAPAATALSLVTEESSMQMTGSYDALLAKEVAKMKEHFSNFTYLIEGKVFIELSTGKKFDKEQFNDKFCVPFAKKIDHSDPKKAPKVIETTDASTAFIRSELSEIAGNKKVDSMIIDNSIGYGEIVERRGSKVINMFKGLTINPVEGDTSLFHDYMDRLFECQGDKEIVLDYMAAMIQHCGGEKIKHGPFIQGVQGNGKSTIGKIVRKIIGEEVCAIPSNGDINERYNGWALGKLFATVEEVKVKGFEVMDSLKTLITEDSISYRLMKTDSFLADNRCNFMFFSNHKDALLIDRNERRYSVFFTKQQTVEDLARDFGGDPDSEDNSNGPGVKYFDKLYEWLNDGGYANICHELIERDISSFSLGRAPRTSNLQEAINHGLSNNASILQDGIDAGEIFGEGRVVSLSQIDDYLMAKRVNMSAKQKGYALKELGFIDPDNEADKPKSYRGKLMSYTVWKSVKHRFMIHKDEVLNIPNGQVATDNWKQSIPRSYELSKTMEG